MLSLIRTICLRVVRGSLDMVDVVSLYCFLELFFTKLLSIISAYKMGAYQLSAYEFCITLNSWFLQARHLSIYSTTSVGVLCQWYL